MCAYIVPTSFFLFPFLVDRQDAYVYVVHAMTTSSKHDTVAIRFPRALWLAVRQRALAREETGLSYLSRCARVCLEVASSGVPIGGVVASAVEPGHTEVHHRDGTGRCQHATCVPHGCRGFKEGTAT